MLSACRIELGIGVETVMSRQCDSVNTWDEKGSNARALRVSAGLRNLDPGIYDFHVRIFCDGLQQSQHTVSAVVMYPEILEDECVPELAIADQSMSITIVDDHSTCVGLNTLTSFVTNMVLIGCQQQSFEAHYF